MRYFLQAGAGKGTFGIGIVFPLPLSTGMGYVPDGLTSNKGIAQPFGSGVSKETGKLTVRSKRKRGAGVNALRCWRA